jgi:hypothetical protein
MIPQPSTPVRMNSLETYKWSGLRAGSCQLKKDHAACRFEQEWFHLAKFLERDLEYRKQAEDAWNEGYREGSGFYNNKPEYFR